MATSGLILGMGIFLFLVFPFKFIAKITGIVLGFILFVSLWFIEWVEHLPGAVAYGFSISFLEVFLAFMLVLFLFFLAKNRFHFLIGFGFSLLFFSVLAYRRYGFLKQEECIIFNARSLIVTLRKKDHYYCFYKCKPDEFEKKVKYVVENYRKQLPAPIDYFSIQDSNWKLSSPDFNFELKEKKNYSKEITLNKKKITVVFSHQFVPEKRGEYIAMPWVKTSGMYSLNNGAYKFIIE
jgi:hypothetical protein